MEILITAGGTSEPIDDVRAVTNFSTGRYGLAIAHHAAKAAERVTVAGSRLALANMGDDLVARTDQVTFTDTDSLAEILTGWDRTSDDPVVIHAAAVSDYKPVRAAGKLSSSGDELVIRMTPTPKLIDTLRDTYGQRAFLVGFKLLSGVTQAELIAAARTLLKRARLNLVVANDLAECRDGQHPMWLVTQEGGAIRVEGSRDETAHILVQFIAGRRNVTWAATVTQPGEVAPDVDGPSITRFARLLSFAQRTGLLCDTNGNAAARITNPDWTPDGTDVSMLVTPRQVDKATVAVGECCVACIDLDRHQVHSYGDVKSSIDTSVQGRILDARPDTTMVLHFHHALGRADVTTRFPFPCGAAEEADEVLELLAGIDGHNCLRGAGLTPCHGECGGEPFATWQVELIHHGFLLGLVDADLDRLEAEWAHTMACWSEHLDDVGSPEVEPIRLSPIFDGVHIVGIAATFDDGNVALHVNPDHRGGGLGRILAAQLRSRFQGINTIDACEVRDFWAARGFSITGGDGTWSLVPDPVTGTDALFEHP